jgi:nucleotide-binding universal stress UspA family protein
MYDSILVPLDGSEYAEEVIPHAVFLAKSLDCRVILYTALFVASDPHRHVPEDELRASLAHSGAADYLDGWARELGTRGVAASVTLGSGPPADAIIRTAAEQQPGLIAMTTFGHSGPGAWVLGSVSDRVISAVSTPVLLVRPRSMPLPELTPTESIVVALDGSDLAEAALVHAETLALRMHAPIKLITAVDYGERAWSSPDAEPPPGDERWAREYLEARAAHLRLKGLPVDWEVAHGAPAGAIIKAASQQSRPLVVMATHGRSGRSRWVLGSIANKVVHAYDRPILLVHPGSTASPQ